MKTNLISFSSCNTYLFVFITFPVQNKITGLYIDSTNTSITSVWKTYLVSNAPVVSADIKNGEFAKTSLIKTDMLLINIQLKQSNKHMLPGTKNMAYTHLTLHTSSSAGKFTLNMRDK